MTVGGSAGTSKEVMSSSSPTMTLAHAGQPKVEYATPLEDDENRLDAYDDDESLRYHMVVNILGEQSPPG